MGPLIRGFRDTNKTAPETAFEVIEGLSHLAAYVEQPIN